MCFCAVRDDDERRRWPLLHGTESMRRFVSRMGNIFSSFRATMAYDDDDDDDDAEKV
jgi:hypothetical protein